MTDCVVLREKLRIPEVSGLARPRLEQPLLAGPQTIVDMVVAPAGCGKTTLLSRVAAASAVPVGWYRVTADDSTEHRLVAHLATALSAVADTAAVGSLAELVETLDVPGGSGGMLILDDVHEIADTPAERALERFISLRPRRLQLICGSRRLPDINVPRIRVSGSIRETGSDDLRFRSWEVEELFASVYREPLRPEAAAALTRRTGGWAAGLQLFHLATVGRSAAERHQAVAALGGRSKLVRSYLTRNVLAELPAQRRAFLLRTCALGRLSGEACDALLGINGSHRILEELETAQLFTFTDDGGVYFRYHEVLQAHLELALVEEYGPAEAKAWYLKSARVLEALGEQQQAARAFAKAGDWASVSRLVQDAGGVRIDATVVDDAHLLPASTWQHDPWLALAHARRLVREGALVRAAEAYRNAQKLYDEPNYQQICRFEARVVSTWLPPGGRQMTAAVAHWSNALRDALHRVPDLTARVPADDLRGRLVQGLAAVAAGELRRARDVLGLIGEDEPADPLARVVAGLALAAVDLIDGRATDPAARFSTIAIDADNEGLPWVSRLCHGLEQIALVVAADAVWRLDGCAHLVDAAEQMGDQWGAGLLRWVIGVVKQRMGQDGTAELLAAETVFADLGAPVLQLWCRLAAIQPGDSAYAKLVETCRTLHARGAHAFALGRLGADGAAELARQCGIPLAATTYRTPDEPRSAFAAASQVVEASLPPVAITCFGGYRIAIDGEGAELSTLRPQARSVLQILSMAPGRDHHRETLEDILWPGVDHSVACHRLQVAVSSVRTMFGDTGMSIRRSGESYRLCLPERATVDVRDFTDALARAAAASARGDLRGRVAARQEALNLYTGDLLPEITGQSTIDSERERLRLAAAGAAAGLASDYRTLGEFEQALIVAQRSVQLDPYQDSAWLVLADLHETLGDESSAEYVRREHARMQADLEFSTI
ncbi:BTAD domain-containing putative transcriptional regulator [Mycolicibacterium sp.]|uniref:BTAD domain-containing putative transcriptional regulator n=1 Tax=Mycolicibacterium sp. TaxID=2320850 RepID=UPI0037CA5EEF